MGHNIWGGCCGGGFWNLPGMGYVSPILNLLLTVVVIVGLAWLLITLIKRSGSREEPHLDGNSAGKSTSSVLEVLKMRYARGEISREEYLEIQADIE